MLFKNKKIGDMILFEHHLKEWRKSHSISIQDIGAEPANTFSQCSSNSASGPSLSETNQQEVTLSQIFNENKKIKQITDYYNENSRLLCHHRSLLIDIICNYFEENSLHMSLSTSYQIEEQIILRFPTEKLQYYRTSKRGKIYMKFYNSKCSRNTNKKKTVPDEPTPDKFSTNYNILCKYLIWMQFSWYNYTCTCT